MALVFEDGTGKADANSYASAAEFDAYAGNHLYADAWTAASAGRRETALIQATRTIDALVAFVGRRAVTGQRLEWPRYFPRDPVPRSWAVGQAPPPQPFEGELVPQRLKDATCELAMALLASNRTADAESAGIAELGLGQGALAIKFAATDRPKALPELVQAMLAPMGGLRSATSGQGVRVRV